MKFQFLCFIAFISTHLAAQSTDSITIRQVDSLIKVSQNFMDSGKFEKALEVNAVAKKIALDSFGRLSVAYGICCSKKGLLFRLKGDYTNAENWFQEAMTIQEQVLGHQHPDYATSMLGLAYTYILQGKEREAEPLCEEVRSIWEKALGKEHPKYSMSLNFLANVKFELSKYDEALPIHLENKEIIERKWGKENEDYTLCLNNIALVEKEMGEYSDAESHYIESKSIMEKIGLKENPNYAGLLENLANVNKKLGDLEVAEQYHMEAKVIREKIFGKYHPVYAKSILSLGLLYSELGQFEKSESFLLEAKMIIEKTLGKEHHLYSQTLSNLANLYMKLGQSDQVEKLYIESLDICEKSLGKQSTQYAITLTNLAGYYSKAGQFEKAEPLHLEGLVILSKIIGKQNLLYASTLAILANQYFELLMLKEAEPMFIEAMDIIEKVVGKDHVEYGIILHNFSLLKSVKGENDAAVEGLKKSIDILLKTVGDKNNYYSKSLRELGNIYEYNKQYSASELLQKEAYEIEQMILLKAISFLSESELASYEVNFNKVGDDLGSYLLARKVHNLITMDLKQLGILPTLTYNHAIFYKGFLLNAANQVKRIALSDSISTKKYNELKSYERRLATELSKPIAERKTIEELEEKTKALEKDLARSVAGIGDAMRQTNWQEVNQQLKPGDAAIEFVSFKVKFPINTDNIMYTALLLKPGLTQPIFIPLFEEKSLDSLLHSKSEIKEENVNNLYSLVTRGATPLEMSKKSFYESLFEMIWKPLEKELKGIKTIYFSPTGMLHQINQNAIPISKTTRLSDKYKLIELNSTRQLVIPNKVKVANNDAVLYGGIQYEQDSSFKNTETLVAYHSRGELSFTQIDSTSRGGSWNYLDGTESEVNSIEKIMKTNGIHAKLKKGDEATEESFKNINVNNSSSPRILHIATHGYFFPDPDRTSSAKSRMTYDSMVSEGTAKAASSNVKILQSESELVFKISEHPMLRSGLIMAGGNAAWQGKQALEGREDGILTAYEISQMNLSNTELVVLSACETGLGDIKGNEGVYGLQRAFKIAGAKYLIMSLWQVPDKQTSLLMTTFYKKWLQEKMTIPDAFHAAQKELREIGLDPYQWAGFILVE